MTSGKKSPFRLVGASPEPVETPRGRQEALDATVTETEIARLLVAKYGHLYRYNVTNKSWYEFVGHYWRKTERSPVFNIASELAYNYSELLGTSDQKKIRRTGFADAVVKSASRYKPIVTIAGDWDRDTYLLGTPGGVVDLRTGILRDGRPEDMISKAMAVAPSDTSACPRFLQFLNEATGNDEGLITFLRQFFGYTLTGDTSAQCFLFIHGGGGNGKSVLTELMRKLFSGYGHTAPIEVLLLTTHPRHATSQAALAGARYVNAAETPKGRQWNETLLKQLTGGDSLTANFMHCNEFTFDPVLKLIISGNFKPNMSDVSDAMKRRTNIVPFTRKPAVVDTKLIDKLLEEAPDILRWMIGGCLDWQQRGLVRPESVTVATNDYFNEQDTLTNWISECCDVNKDDDSFHESSMGLFNSYGSFCQKQQKAAGSSSDFKKAMEKAGYQWEATRSGKIFHGIKLAQEGLADDKEPPAYVKNKREWRR